MAAISPSPKDLYICITVSTGEGGSGFAVDEQRPIGTDGGAVACMASRGAFSLGGRRGIAVWRHVACLPSSSLPSSPENYFFGSTTFI